MNSQIIFCDRNGISKTPVVIKWDCPYFPRTGDTFLLEDFVSNLEDDLCNLYWEVTSITWYRYRNKTMADIYLINEFEQQSINQVS